ncbi:hypothetical protein R5R35_005155 [Gryllus longicercus]|uniref:Uncharacterized protein n=1 Tax=Gryllus longicercus TaxID=2509291 RepID=A0AAN9YWK4_9ORTH
MSISTQMDILDELCSRVGNINLSSSIASITSVGKLEDELIYNKMQNGNESVDDIASVQFARLQDASSVEGSPTVALPVYITPSTFPGKEGELLLIPARRMSNWWSEGILCKWFSPRNNC